MDACEVIPAILDAISYSPDKLLSTLKNRYKSAQNMSKNNEASFQLLKWVRKNYIDIMHLIAFSLGLVQPEFIFIGDVDNMRLDDDSRRTSANSLMVVIIMLTSPDFDNEKSEWIGEVRNKTVKISLALQAALNKIFDMVIEDSTVIYYTCQMIYDFFFCFLANYNSASDFMKYANNVFSSLLRKEYYKKRVLIHFKEHYESFYRNLESEEIQFTKEGKYIIRAFSEERLDRANREYIFSNNRFYYCKDELSLPIPIKNLSKEDLRTKRELYNTFLTEKTFRQYIQATSNKKTSYEESHVAELLIKMIEHNYLVCYTNKSEEDLLNIIGKQYFAEIWVKNDKITSLYHYLDSIQRSDYRRFFSAISMPLCISEFPKIEWIWRDISDKDNCLKDTAEKQKVYSNEATRRGALAAVVHKLWEKSALTLQTNKDAIPFHTFCSDECVVKNYMKNHLKFFMQSRTASEIMKYGSRYNKDYDSIREMVLLNVLVLSGNLLVCIPDWKRKDDRLYKFQSVFQSKTKSPTDDFTKLWVHLKNPMSCLDTLSKCRKLTSRQNIDFTDMLDAIFSLVEADVFMIQTPETNQYDDLSNAYRLFCLLVLGE